MLNSKKHNRDAGRIGETEISVSDQETINQTSRRNNVNNGDIVNTLFLLLLKSKGLHDGFV